jgi:hypothetical protein
VPAAVAAAIAATAAAVKLGHEDDSYTLAVYIHVLVVEVVCFL